MIEYIIFTVFSVAALAFLVSEQLNFKLSSLHIDSPDGYNLGTSIAFTKDQVYDAVKRSKTVQINFAKTTFDTRRKILCSIRDWILENQDLICRISSRDTGKTLLDSTFGEILPTLEKLNWTISNGEKILAPEYRESGSISMLTSARVEYRPVGVMGLIVSWNYPFHNVISPLISALMAGNGLVVKCSEHTSWTTKFLRKFVSAVLELHDIDDDLVSFIDGYGDAGEALVESADKITFIGSPGVGKIVMKKASETITPVVLELGGKDAAIIFEDCDYPNMLNICLRGALQNAGQNCAGLERLIVHEKIFDKLVGDLKSKIGALRIGAPFDEGVCDVGAITMKNQIPIISGLVNDAVSKGALLICGGDQYTHPKYPKGQYFKPTVLSNITSDMRIHHEEVFGPVILVYKFSTEQEAINICNATEFGLSSSVFSKDYKRADRVASQLNVGMTNINGWGFSYLCQSLPFGGVRKSGFDRFGGAEGLRGNCFIKSCTTDKFRALGIRTNVPDILNFPLKKDSFPFQAALIEIFYSPTISGKIGGVWKVLNLFVGKKK